MPCHGIQQREGQRREGQHSAADDGVDAGHFDPSPTARVRGDQSNPTSTVALKHSSDIANLLGQGAQTDSVDPVRSALVWIGLGSAVRSRNRSTRRPVIATCRRVLSARRCEDRELSFTWLAGPPILRHQVASATSKYPAWPAT